MLEIGQKSQIIPPGACLGGHKSLKMSILVYWRHKTGSKVSQPPQKMTQNVTFYDRFSSLGHFSGSHMLEIGSESQIAPPQACLGLKLPILVQWRHKIMSKTNRTPPRNDQKCHFFHRFKSLGHLFQVLHAINWSNITNYTLLGIPGGVNIAQNTHFSVRKTWKSDVNSHKTPGVAPGQSEMTQKSPRPHTFLPTWHNNSLVRTNQPWS